MLKEDMIKKIALMCRREGYDYEDMRYVFRRVREQLKLRPEQKKKKLPEILTNEEVEKFFNCIEQTNVKHSILFRLMYYTGMRINECCGLEIKDIDLEGLKVKVVNGKGGKERYVMFPKNLKLPLQAYLAGLNKQRYLFESRQYQRFTTRRIQQLFKKYLGLSGIEKDVTPHSLRHSILTYLTGKGLTDSQIQVISGHSRKDTLAIYQHISLGNVANDYQKAF